MGEAIKCKSLNREKKQKMPEIFWEVKVLSDDIFLFIKKPQIALDADTSNLKGNLRQSSKEEQQQTHL